MSTDSTWNSHWKAEAARAYWQEPAAEILRLRDSLDPGLNPDVLDLGCGIGRHAVAFAESGFSVTAVDAAPNALEILRNTVSEKELAMTVVEADCRENLFPEFSFDLVIAYNVLYHGLREDFADALWLVYTYLKPGGLFFFTCPTRKDAKYGNGEKVADHVYRPENSVHPGDIHYFADEADISDFLKDFTTWSADIEEHYWDHNGVTQFSSTWQVLAQK